MSRIGRMPIAVPAGVTVDIAENNKVTVKGPKGERLIILRSDYLRLQLDSEEAERLRGLEATYQYSTLNEMQAKLDLIEKQCEYWQKQATSAQSQLKEAAQNATKWHEAYDELNRNIDQQIEQGRLSAARQDALELKHWKRQQRRKKGRQNDEKRICFTVRGAGPRRYGENGDPCKSHDSAGNT